MPWRYSDLKLLDPVDAVLPEDDLIAVYARIKGGSFKIRLDILDLVSLHDLNIFIPIDTHPGGETQIIDDQYQMSSDIAWDYLVLVPASGHVQIVDSNYIPLPGMEVLISRDPQQDTIEIRFKYTGLREFSNFTKFQVLLMKNDEREIVDQSSPFVLSATSPSMVKVSFIFWNTIESKNPAQSLRSWAGAHSGPMSGRHGLKYLLESSESTNIPIFLTDLSDCESLSALDYLGVIPYINSLADKLLVNKPIYILCENIKSLNKMDLYRLVDNKNNIFIFLSGYDYTHINDNQQDREIFPFVEGLTPSERFVEFKSLLVAKAISGIRDPLIFGGDFSFSWFGDPAFVTQLFTFIQNQQWIKIIGVTDMSGVTDVNTSPYPATINDYFQANEFSNTMYDEIYKLLLSTPGNQITNMAWQAFSNMLEFDTVEDTRIGFAYIGQLGHLLSASTWYENPGIINDCSTDLDFDHQNECILSNENIFMTIEPNGGFIPVLFYRDDEGIHQIIGPTWEFSLKLSDPTMWDISNGVHSDPGQILGALYISDGNLIKFEYVIGINNLLLYNDDISMRIFLELTPDSMKAHIRNENGSPLTISIPLVVDPWNRYSPGWGDRYTYAQSKRGITWGYDDFIVEVNSNQPITIYPFNVTKELMSFPEDPNLDYARGHYLPYPIALAEVLTNGTTDIELVIDP